METRKKIEKTKIAFAGIKLDIENPIELFTDRVLVRVEGGDEKTVGGIIIPESVRENFSIGTVITVGDGYIDTTNGNKTPLRSKVGDFVFHSPFAGTEIMLDILNEKNEIVKAKHLIMRDSDIYGKLNTETGSLTSTPKETKFGEEEIKVVKSKKQGS